MTTTADKEDDTNSTATVTTAAFASVCGSEWDDDTIEGLAEPTASREKQIYEQGVGRTLHKNPRRLFLNEKRAISVGINGSCYRNGRPLQMGRRIQPVGPSDWRQAAHSRYCTHASGNRKVAPFASRHATSNISPQAKILYVWGQPINYGCGSY